MLFNCIRCQTEIKLGINQQISFREECPKCRLPLHSCKLCIHFDLSYSKQCKETQAELVKDKDKNNFCEYFRLNTAADQVEDQRAEQLQKLDDLFKD